MGWARSKEVDAVIPWTDFAAFAGSGQAMAVICVPLPPRTHDVEMLTQAMIVDWELEKPGNDILKTSDYRQGKLAGQEVEAQRLVDGVTTHCLLRVVADKECALPRGRLRQ